MNRAGIDLIKRFEGFRPNRYLCPAGKPTIGYGHVIQPGEAFYDSITEVAAEKLLLRDIEKIEKRVIDLVLADVNENQLAALVSFAYNAGIAALRGSTLLKLLNGGAYKSAAKEFLRWDKYTDPATGKKVPLAGLMNRRLAEKSLFDQKDELV